MLHRGASVVLAMSLYVATLPVGNITAATAEEAGPQDREQMDIMLVDDGNPHTDEFSARYWTGEQYVDVNGYSAESDTYYVPTPDGGWREVVDYFYSDNIVTRPDGNYLSTAVYEFYRPTSQNLLYLTLGGVTITFDLNAQQAYPLSEADYANLQAWEMSADARLTRDTSATLLDQASHHAELDALLSFYAIAMFVDPADHVPPDEAVAKINRRGGLPEGALGRFMAEVSALTRANFIQPCSTQPASAFTSINNLFSLTPIPIGSARSISRQGSCYCCGLGCRCLVDRWGRIISGPPCTRHDQCVRAVGSLTAPRCWGWFAGAVAFTIWTYRESLHPL